MKILAEHTWVVDSLEAAREEEEMMRLKEHMSVAELVVN